MNEIEMIIDSGKEDKLYHARIESVGTGAEGMITDLRRTNNEHLPKHEVHVTWLGSEFDGWHSPSGLVLVHNNLNDELFKTETVNLIKEGSISAGDCLKVKFNNSDTPDLNNPRNAMVRYTSDEVIYCFILGYGKEAKNVSIHVDDLKSKSIEILKIMK